MQMALRPKRLPTSGLRITKIKSVGGVAERVGVRFKDDRALSIQLPVSHPGYRVVVSLDEALYGTIFAWRLRTSSNSTKDKIISLEATPERVRTSRLKNSNNRSLMNDG